MNDILSTVSTKLQRIPFRERPGLVALATSTAVVIPFAVRNYFSFLRLKPPKPLANPLGWLLALSLRLIGRESKSTQEYEEPAEDRRTWLGEGFAWRKGDRPEIGWFPAPHRQTTQWSTADIHEKLTALLKDVAALHPTALEIRTSGYELRADALFVARHPITNTSVEACRTASGEIAHIHDTFDYSLHVVLAPQDCKKVIQHGWGERHPCSGRIKSLPKEYLLIYVPRDEEELTVVKEIVKAATSFMSGQDFS